MWCRTCEQDVPAVVRPDERERPMIYCARCGGPLSSGVADPTSFSVQPANSPQPAQPENLRAFGEQSPLKGPPPELLHDMGLEQSLRTAERWTRRLSLEPKQDPQYRMDSVHADRTPPAHAKGWRAKKLTGAQARSKWLAWVLLTLGLMVFACGVSLVIGSHVAPRPQLWSAGAPIVLAGQTLLVIGLLLHVFHLAKTQQEAAERLSSVQQQLAEMRRTSALLTSSQSSTAQSFYAHLAQGAGSDLLLADLQGQLDLLSRKMSQDAA